MSTSEPTTRAGRPFLRVVVWVLLTSSLSSGLALSILYFAWSVRGPVLAKVFLIAAACLALPLLIVVLRSVVLAVVRVWRFPGYPGRHWKVVRGTLRNAILAELIVGAPVMFLSATAMLVQEEFLNPITRLAVFVDVLLLLVMLPLGIGVSEVMCCAQVVPYFARRVGDIDTFCNGMYLARNLADLDSLAGSLGVVPLSTFGWNDDMHGEPLVWHGASTGLKTVKTLLAHFEGEDLPRGDWSGIVDDLKRIAGALIRAEDGDIAFCLLLRHAQVTCQPEWDQRKGTCF